jgi:hypothetical protein
MQIISKCVAVVLLTLLAGGCIPLMAIGGASSLYGYHKDSILDDRISALEARSQSNTPKYAYAPYVPSIFQK